MSRYQAGWLNANRRNNNANRRNDNANRAEDEAPAADADADQPAVLLPLRLSLI